MLVYLVEKICDFEYGCRKVVKVFNNEESARNYVNEQPDVGDVEFWTGENIPMYEITPFEVEE